MNSVEIEENVRNLALMLGTSLDFGHGNCVLAHPDTSKSKRDEPELVIERYEIGSDGKMRVVRLEDTYLLK